MQIKYNLAWLMGTYYHISNHNPKAFPKKPEQIIKEDVKMAQTDEDQNAVIDFLLT